MPQRSIFSPAGDDLPPEGGEPVDRGVPAVCDVLFRSGQRLAGAGGLVVLPGAAAAFRALGYLAAGPLLALSDHSPRYARGARSPLLGSVRAYGGPVAARGSPSGGRVRGAWLVALRRRGRSAAPLGARAAGGATSARRRRSSTSRPRWRSDRA